MPEEEDKKTLLSDAVEDDEKKKDPVEDDPLPQEGEDKIEALERATTSMKDQLDRRESLIKREERMYIERQVGGKALAGEQKEVKKEETPTEYKDRIMRGDLTDNELKEAGS